MKKIALSLLSIVLTLCVVSSCGTTMMTEQEASGRNQSNYSMFVLLETNNKVGYKIVCHKDTKVMYAISDGAYNHGTFTVLLNPDGTPMLWKGGD